MITLDTRLVDIVSDNPLALPLLMRFGIRSGFGSATVAEESAHIGTDPSFMLEVLNSFSDPDYSPDWNSLPEFEKEAVAYLSKTDHYYSDTQLVNISRHFDLLLRSTRNSGNLQLLQGFFGNLAELLTSRIRADLDRIFPYISGDLDTLDVDINDILEIDDRIEDQLSDLFSFLVMHLKGDFDANLWVAVVNAVSMLDKDIRQTNRIRRSILGNLSSKISKP